MIALQPQPTAIALTIAGSDPSGGAGIQADLKTFTALGVYGASVITALTAQNTLGVTGVMVVPADFITAQLDAVAGDLNIGAVKTGMLADEVTLDAVIAGLKRHRLRPLVVDPVMVATSGDVLLAPDAINAVRSRLLPLADVITPNLHEAAMLLDEPVGESEAAMVRQGEKLRALGAKTVLIKGGHLQGGNLEDGGARGAMAVDLLVSADGVQRFQRPHLDTRHTHGTGCTLSAAIAAELAKGRPLTAAVQAAKDYVWAAIKAGATLGVGHGNGPVDHLVNIRPSGPRP